ncbi:hypothetical protein AB1Y20_020559 [Prymnesium parvum]|uniref:UV excision repair protein RAD23 n=1 Tax=Prymnesium parvum TaxID=97485 RepID=A0AB34JYF6_PRYPA
MQLQVRQVDGTAFWVKAELDATVVSVKQTIMELRGIDVVMQKLICAGRLLLDELTLELCNVTPRDFLVLVTAKPRPPSLMTTGAPLPSSYQTGAPNVGDGDEDGDDVGEEGDEDTGEIGEDEDGTDEAEENVGRLVDMGFPANDAEEALRLSHNDMRRAMAILRSGGVSGGVEAVRALHQRLRSISAFRALQQVVRVDPQIMLVLNTELMRFEDPKSSSLNSDGSAGSLEGHREREEVERAFWEACSVELMDTPPVYDRTQQLIQEVRDTLCSLMPPEWDDQLLLAADHAEHMRAAIEKLRETGGRLSRPLVTKYIRDVSAQVRMLCSEARMGQMENLLRTTLQPLEAAESEEGGVEWSGGVGEEGEWKLAGRSEWAEEGRGNIIGDDTHADGEGEKTDTSFAAAEDSHQSSFQAQLPALLLRFFRSSFELLEGVKLDLANQHLSRLLDQDSALITEIGQHPNDFVMLLNAGEDGDGADGVEFDVLRRIGGYGAAGPSSHRDLERMDGGFPRDLDYRGSGGGGGSRRHGGGGLYGRGCNTRPTGMDGDDADDGAEDDYLSEAPDVREMHGMAELMGQVMPQRPDLPPAQEAHSELMEAVMQQWLQTPAGQAAAQEAARLDLNSDEVGQFFHARMLQSLGRLRIDNGHEHHVSADGLQLAAEDLPEEAEGAVNRLTALGFSRAQAVEAYLACDQDEMLAANFLMDHQ